MPTIEDKEFGSITVRRSARSSSMRVSVAPNGSLRVSAPSYAPIFMVKRMIASSRDELRRLHQTHPQLELRDGMTIGKSHSLTIRTGAALAVTRSGQRIVLTMDGSQHLDADEVIKLARRHIIEALKREAKHYLPKRLAHLAQQHGFSYSSVRFSHASGRWGSCNQRKVISLNIALMNLPFELIDYVLVHELAHTKHLNHSSAFWETVGNADPNYKANRKTLKSHSPSI